MSTSHHDRPDAACAEFESLIVRAADGQLDPSNRLRVDAHLAGCAACRAALADQRAMAALVATAFDARPAAGFSTRVLAQLQPTESWLDRLDFRRWTWRVSPVAAALALAAWLVASATQTATALEATTETMPTSEQADTLTWDDVVTEGDMVSLIWQAEVGADSAIAIEEISQ